MSFHVHFAPEKQMTMNIRPDSEPMAASFDNTYVIETSDHRRLANRDAPDQHPILAISNLENELSVRSSEAMTNAEIQAILDM